MADSIVYSPLKVFAFPDHAGGALRRAPVHVRIKPINACNHGCWFCAYRSDDLSLGEDMKLHDRIPRGKMLELIDDLIVMGVRAVTFSGGGEPLLYPGIADVVNRLGSCGVRVAALTNGSYLRGAVADAFATHGTWVRVSTDAWDDVSNQRLRHCKAGEFERIAENISAFAARKSACDIGVSLIVHRENAEHLYRMCETMKRLGAGHVKLSPCIVSDDGEVTNAYHDAIRETVAAEISHALELQDGEFRIADHYHRFEERFQKQYTTCPMLEFLTVVGADCTVYTCQDKAYRESGFLGSIADRSFASLWGSPEFVARMAAMDPSVRCKHHCVSHAKNALLTEYRALAPGHLDFV